MASQTRDIRVSARLDLAKLRTDFREALALATQFGREAGAALRLRVQFDAEAIKGAARTALRSALTDSMRADAPRSEVTAPEPSRPRGSRPKPAEETDGAQVLDERVAEQEARLAALRAKYRGENKKADREATEQLITDLKRAMDEKRVLLAAGVGLTDKAAKQELAVRKSALDQEIGMLRRVAMEKDAVVNEGAGAGAGILGLFRKVQGADVIGSLKAALPAVAIGSVVKDAIGLGSEFEAGVAELSAITGVAGQDLDLLGTKARQLAMEFGGTASGNVEAFKGILSRLGPDIAKNPAALESMTRAVNTLSAATGDDAAASMDALTTGLLQFQVPLDDAAEAARVMTSQMHVMAAGAQYGAAEVPQVAAAIKVAGVAASGAKVSFEETNAALQALAAGGKVGAEAGTALRNVIGKLSEGRFLPKDTQAELKAAGVDINRLGDTSISLTDRLRELQKIQKDSSLVTKLFGAENAAAAGILLRSVDDIDELKQQITGTTTATEQATVRQATFSAQLDRLVATMKDGLIGAFQAVAPVLTTVLGAIASVISGAFGGIGTLFSFIGQNASVFGILAAGIAAYILVANAAAISTTVLTTAETVHAAVTKGLIAAQKLWNAAMASNPIGLVIVAATALVATLKAVHDAMEVTTEEQIEQNEAEAKLVEQQKAANQAQQDRARTVVQLASEYERLGSKANRTLEEEQKLGKLQSQLNTQYPGLISGTKSFGENLSAVRAQAATAKDSIAKLSDEMVALDRKSRELAIRNLALQSELAFNGVVDSLSDGLPGLFTSGKAQEIAEPFLRAINAAKTDPALQAAINSFQQRIFDLKSSGDLDAEETVEINAKIQELATARFKLLAAMRGDDQKKPDAAVPEPTPTTEPKKDPKEPVSFEQQRKQYENQARQIRGELAAKNLTDERARIKAEYQLKRDTISGEETKTLEELKRQKEAGEKEGKSIVGYDTAIAARKALTTQELKRLQEEESDQLNGLVTRQIEEEQKVAEAAAQRKVETLKSELSALTTSQERINDTTSTAFTLRLAKQKEIQEQERIILHTGLVSQNSEFQSAFRERQQLLDQEKITESQFQSDIIELRARFTEQLKSDPRLKELDERIAKENEEAEREIGLRRKRERIAEEEDIAKQKLETQLLELDEQLAADLAANKLNEARKVELLREHAAKRREVIREYYRTTNLLHAVSLSVEEGLREAFDRKQDDRAKQEAAKKRDELDKETRDLEDALVKRQIGYREYYEKLRQLQKKREEIARESEGKVSAISDFFRQAGIAAATSFEKQQLTIVSKARTDYLSSITRREERRKQLVEEGLDAETAAAQAASENQQQIDEARTAALTSTVTYASAQFLSLVAQGENAGVAMATVVFDALQASIPGIVASIFGQSIGTLGPILGPLASAGLTAAFYALVGLAKGAIIGREHGGIVTGGRQLIWINERNRPEFVVNDRSVSASDNLPALEWTNRTHKPLREYFREETRRRSLQPFTVPSLSHVVVTPSGEIVANRQVTHEISRAFSSAITLAYGMASSFQGVVEATHASNRDVVGELRTQTRTLQKANVLLRDLNIGALSPSSPRNGAGSAREHHRHVMDRLSR